MPMPAEPVPAAERAPRRARYVIPGNTPRRGEFLAAIGIALVILHVIFAQLTLVLALVFFGVTRVSRWRPSWLAAPAAAGLVWTLAVGPAAAVSGFTAGPARVASYLGGIFGHSARLMHLGVAYAGMGHWLPRQLPIALIAGAAEAALAAWLDWLHTDEWDLRPPRPGLIAATPARRGHPCGPGWRGRHQERRLPGGGRAVRGAGGPVLAGGSRRRAGRRRGPVRHDDQQFPARARRGTAAEAGHRRQPGRRHRPRRAAVGCLRRGGRAVLRVQRGRPGLV